MSGTSGSLNSGGDGGIMLPAPKVQMMIPVVRPDVFVADGSPLSGVLTQVVPARYVKVTVPGIPNAVLSDLAKYQPQVELLRYVRRKSRENSSSGNGDKSAAYVHPSHGPTASGNGSFTHGGNHGGTDPAVQAVRPTEWPLLSGADNIDVTQGILGFMCITTLQYRDVADNLNPLGVLIPSHALSRGRGTSFSRFPYQKGISGSYFAFRLSVKDPSDPRGKRIWGPVSDIVQVGNTAFPFLPDGVTPAGSAAAVPNPMHDPKMVNFWLASRLP